MKKGLLLLFTIIAINCIGAHKQGAWFEYTHLGGDSIKVILNVYRDCNALEWVATTMIF